MPIPYYEHSGRRPHLWRVRKDGFRKLLISKKWHLRGAYAEKTIHGRWIMQTIVEKHEDHLVCAFRPKDDWWAHITRGAREREAQELRNDFHVVTNDDLDLDEGVE